MTKSRKIFYTILSGVIIILAVLLWNLKNNMQFYEYVQSNIVYITETFGLKQEENSDIVIGVVWPEGDGGFVEGAMMAQEQINAQGGLNHKKIRFIIENETKYLESARADLARHGRYRNAAQDAGSQIARKLVAEKGLIAVIGHKDVNDTALPASITYESKGILFLASSETNPLLTHINSTLTFQLQPSSVRMAQEIIQFCTDQSYNDVVIIHARDRDSIQTAAFVKKMSSEFGVKIVTSITFYNRSREELSHADVSNVTSSLLAVKNSSFNAIILIGEPMAAQQIVKMSRKLGIHQPFVGSDALESDVFSSYVGPMGKGTVVASVFDETTFYYRQFSKVFEKYSNGKKADVYAGIGYDSVQILANLIRKNHTLNPADLAHALRYQTPLIYGVSGLFGFTGKGENFGKVFTFNELKSDENGILSFVPLKYY
ncbi:MAG: ABC transporter substrate-binding protein [Magnetococcus sp. DMHC-1]|nr:ABC transporter substrate-binding protein [Magnetococcales bacterium]